MTPHMDKTMTPPRLDPSHLPPHLSDALGAAPGGRRPPAEPGPGPRLAVAAGAVVAVASAAGLFAGGLWPL